MEIALFLVKHIVIILTSVTAIVSLLAFFYAEKEHVRQATLIFVSAILILIAVLN